MTPKVLLLPNSIGPVALLKIETATSTVPTEYQFMVFFFCMELAASHPFSEDLRASTTLALG